MALKLNHERFVNEYLVNGYNATQAYMKVYPKASYHVAGDSAYDLLKKPEIQSKIEARKKEIETKYNITQQYLINELLEIIQSCVTEGNDGKGKIKDRQNWNKAVAQLARITGHDVQKHEVKMDVINIGYPTGFDPTNIKDNDDLLLEDNGNI